MRRAGGFLVVLMLLPWAAHAQELEPVELLTDAGGDAMVLGSVVPTTAEAVDLVSLELQEGAEALTFVLVVADRSVQNDVGNRYHIYWKLGEYQYQVFGREQVSIGPNSGVRIDVELQRFDAGLQDWNRIAWLYGDWDGPKLTVKVPRELLIDQNGAPLGLGSQLMDIFVFGRKAFDVPNVEVTDRMPDFDFGLYEIRIGLPQIGDLSLASDDPFRLSNGEATTFVYPLRVQNTAQEAMAVQFEATDLPTGWNAEFLLPSLELEAGEIATVPVVVDIPFRHEHGASDALQVTVRDSTGASRASIQVGVTYTAPPQPAGHHPRLYLHAQENGDEIYPQIGGIPVVSNALYSTSRAVQFLSTDELDERSSFTPLRGRPGTDGLLGGVPPAIFDWTIPLNPSLGLGLDFVTTSQGLLELELETGTDFDEGSLQGGLWLENATDRTLLAEVPEVPIQAGTQRLSIELPVMPEADSIPYQQEQNIVLELVAKLTRPGTTEQVGFGPAPSILPGSYLELPLLEYVRPIEQELNDPSVQLALDRSQLTLQPGALASVTLSLASDTSGTYRIGVLGQAKGLLDTLPSKLTISGGEARATFLVTGPADDITSILYLAAVHEDDVNKRAVVPLVLIGSAEAEESSAQLNGKDKSTSSGFLLPLVGILAVVLARRTQP